MSNPNTVFILASDKESLKSSLIQVDKFLDKVGQSIQEERDYLRNLARRQSLYPNAQQFEAKTRAHEDLESLFSDGNVFKESTPGRQHKYQIDNLQHKTVELKQSNFLKAIADLDDKSISTASTVKLSLAISGLKNLVKHDIDIKSERNADKVANDIIRKVKEKLNGYNDKNETKVNNVKVKRGNNKHVVRVDDTKVNHETKDDLNSDFDIFDDMDFPTQSGFPMSVSLVTTTPTPEIMKPDYITEHVIFADDFLKTETPTTDVDEVLLDPKKFGYSTTHIPISTYGDISDPPSLPPELLTTTRAPDDFVKAFRNQMEQLNVGVFSVAMLKIFEFAKFKEPKILRRLSWGLARLFESYDNKDKLDEFGEPTKDAIRKITNQIGETPTDELKSYGVAMYNAMLHRREMFSKDVNSIVDYIDSLYLKEEADNVIASIEKLDQFNNQKKIPYRELISFVESILAPKHRLENSPKGEILKESLNRGIRNHFYPDGRVPELKNRRQNSREKVAEDTSQDKTNVQSKKDGINGRRNIDVDVETNLFWQPQEPPLQIPIQNGQLSLNENIMRTKKHIHRMATNKMQVHSAVTNKHNSIIFTNNKMNAVVKNNNMLMTNNNIKNMITDINVNNIMTTKGNVFEITMSAVTPVALPTGMAWSRSVTENSKKLVLINKKDEVQNQDNILKMSSSSKKHHKKHRHTHARLKHKISKILRFIKQFQPNLKRSKHKKHHHKRSKHKNLLRSGDNNNQGLNIDKILHNEKEPTPKDKTRFRNTKPDIITKYIPNKRVYHFTTQFYEVNRKSRRRVLPNNDDSKIKQPSTESDEVPLKINLYRDNTKDKEGLNGNLAETNDNIIKVKDYDKLVEENEKRAAIRSWIYNYLSQKYDS